MANLILKPSTGGVLKLQNDAGTVDALTVSTGGNLTAAGTLGVTGNTTLAGTANNLGTVTAGNISHADIVYPAGHVKKITSYQPTVGTTAIRSSNGNTTIMTTNFTPLSSTTHLLVSVGYGYQFYGDSSSDDGSASFYHKHNGVIMHASNQIDCHANNIGGSTVFHISFPQFSQYYIAVDHGSASGQRVLLVSATAQINRLEYGTQYGQMSITVEEF